MTEMAEVRGQGRDRSLVRLGDFRSRQKIVVSPQDFLGLCRNRIFYVVIEFGQGKRVSCRDITNLGHDRVSQARDFLS